MQIDKITFNDISVFHAEEEFSIFHKLNFTKTIGGKEWLRRFFTEPHGDLKRIIGTQNIIKTFLNHIDDWPPEITNGTIIVMDKFYDYNLDPIPANSNAVTGLSYKLLHSADYSMVKYSVKHFADFFRGIFKIMRLFIDVELPANLHYYIERMAKVIAEVPLQRLAQRDPTQNFTLDENLFYGYHLKVTYRTSVQELMDIYSRLEAWYSMAVAVKTFDLHFPQFIDQEQPYLEA
ncbi:MAG TPA: DNA mismatch repair protein MutS, partial [Flavisolibacter sp.]|nr:DNA mismatch repair protein MutS [Flavisolibacter sp.]